MEYSKDSPFGKRYEILDHIGQGGMGRVYKVYDRVRDEILALKELSRKHIDSPAAILGFKNEFRIMSEFQHPNMVQVFEFGMSRYNVPFITMEFISGKNLSCVSGLSTEDIVDILIRICQVLTCIHSRLYVHRDLKPDNIKYTDGGALKLLDYGIMSQIGISSPGAVSGTYHYLAPEAIVGGIIDESTDIYSLGVIAYEMLTGSRPFTGTRKEILQGHLKEIPAEPCSLRSDIPGSVSAIIMKMLEKDKSSRYRKCPDVLEDLQNLAGTQREIETHEVWQGYLYSSKMAGRDLETEYFKQILKSLANEKSASMFIGAAPGMGKTRLLNEMKTLGELEGIHSLYINSQMAGEGIYAWINALIRQIIPLSESGDIRIYGDKLSRISDDIIPRSFNPVNDIDIKEALVCWLASLTQEFPLILFLDDLQWADLKSLQILNEVIRNKDRFKMLIIAGFRNNEIGKRSLLWHTIEEGITEYSTISPLNRKQTRILIENLLYPSNISDEFADYCFNNCGGNIFDLIEFLRYLITEGHLTKSGRKWLEPVNTAVLSLPANIEERLILRINKLMPEIRAMADAASVLGDDLDLESWQAVCGCGEERFFPGIDELMIHQIMIKTDEAYEFSHDKIQSALYDNLEESQKQHYHLKIAEFLEKKREQGSHGHLLSIASHYVSACESDKAVKYSLEAAKAAEENQAEWEAFAHYRNAAAFLEENQSYPGQKDLLLEIYKKPALFSSAVWIDASTCLTWLQKAIDYYVENQDMENVFNLSLYYIGSASITGNYKAARIKISEIIDICNVKEGTIQWAVLYGAVVCLADWYQGYQNDCFNNAAAAIDIFEKELDSLPKELWPSYSWSLFWRDKARAYMGRPVEMANVEKIHQLMTEGSSDKTVYWHTLTAVTARAAFTGRWDDLISWTDTASRLSKEMGKIYWFECWISHSYLYGAIHYGEFSQLENHIEKVQASPDPYQVRLAYLFRGMLYLAREDYHEAEQNLKKFLDMEQVEPDNSWPEGFVYIARTFLANGELDRAEEYINKGSELAENPPYENPLYQLQFFHLKAELAMMRNNFSSAELFLNQSLEMAEEMDNPIQKGFIYKLWGKLYMDKQPDIAVNHFINARDIFLSIGNKYQAGKVVALIEKLARKEESFNEQKIVNDEPADTVLEDHTVTDLEYGDDVDENTVLE